MNASARGTYEQAYAVGGPVCGPDERGNGNGNRNRDGNG